ncbi:MAG: hypothetical protein AAB488_01250 [Patescibacteria group bacterium]
MNNINIQFKKETMLRIYSVFLIKKLYGRIAVKTYILAGLIYIQAKLIFVKAVINNAPAFTDVSALYNFYSYAFLNTQAVTQITMVAGIVTLLWLFRDLLHKENTVLGRI